MDSSSNTGVPVTPFLPKNETNFLALTNLSLVVNQFKCFVQILGTSYISVALTSNHVLYIDILDEFWNSAEMTFAEPKNNIIQPSITCKIKDETIKIKEKDVNAALGIQTVNFDNDPLWIKF